MRDDHAFSHSTAASMLGLPIPPDRERDPRVHVSALRGGRAPRGRGVAGHSTTVDAEVRRFRGLQVMSPSDTWCTLSTMLGLDDLVAAGDRLVGLPQPLATFDEIDAALDRYAGRAGMVRLLRARSELRADSYSRQESLLRLALVRAGLPEPEPNGMITLRSGRRTRGDLVFRGYRVLVEYDGEHHRLDLAQWTTDVARLNDLAADGWLVIRTTKRMPRSELVERTARALRDRGWRG
ncbi:hypothetical protein [Agromyces sp. LHK192]|uniref:hypothetical protein n=1 Tax=Agromyces sp. LHK192 TaxID=2498704 RepID=UPI000FD9A158|nr:hypothetical protein [Agromyces sp. LHK192]